MGMEGEREAALFGLGARTCNASWPSPRQNMITKALGDVIEMLERLTDEELERVKLWISLEDLKKAVHRA